MFNFDITSGEIQDDISYLSSGDISYDSQGVNPAVQSLVLKFIQDYFRAGDIYEGLEAMQEVLESGGGWSLIDTPVQEAFSIECIADISTTSALVKEIIFYDGYILGERFNSCDLGSGTGILTLAAGISALRKKNKSGKLLGGGTLNLIDHEEKSLVRGGEVLNHLLGTAFVIRCILGDITNPQVLHELGEEKINFWISETIGKQTPEFKVLSNGKIIINGDRQMYELSRMIDPFPEVIGNIVSQTSGLIQDIKKGRIALFPDVINEQYLPRGENSSLRLKTGACPQKRKLTEIGRDFIDISSLNESRRW